MRQPEALGPLAQTFKEAMRFWDVEKADGVPFGQRVVNLERVLRASWPHVREWHYLCSSCNDYGLIVNDCPGDATCGRSRPHLAHEFGTPCWCDKGKPFRGKPKPNPDDFKDSGKLRGLTRAGR